MRLSLGDAAFSYTAGQAALLSSEGTAERVPYSIASSPEESARFGYLEFLLKLDANRWGAHLRTLRSGSRLAVEGPFGTFVFPPDPVERQFLFVAGGTGIAPLRSMIGHALQARVKGRLHLLYSARTPADFAYLAEMRRYAASGQLELAVNATREVPKRWRERRGMLAADCAVYCIQNSACAD